MPLGFNGAAVAINDPIATEPSPDLKALHKANELQANLKDFAGVVTKFSVFEVLMSGLGMITTKFDSDWAAYFAEAIAECLENALVADQDSTTGKHKKLSTVLRAPMQLVANIFGIKNKEGKALHNGEVIEAKERIIGGLNVLTSVGSMINTAYQVIKNFILKKPNEEEPSTNIVIGFLTKGFMPTLNAMLMWMSGAGKRYIANAAQEQAPQHYNRQDVNGAMTSGNQDYLCGTSSALLMVRQTVEKIHPTLGRILEPVFALYISVRSLIEGLKALRGEEEHEDLSAKYQLGNLERGPIGKTLYNLAKSTASFFNVKLPQAEQLL